MKKTILGVFLAALVLPLQLKADTVYKKKGPVGISGWVTFWDQGHKSIASFEKHADQIDRAYFEWYKCGPDGLLMPVTDATDELKAKVMDIAAKNNVETWYMTGNYNIAMGDHDTAAAEKLIDTPAIKAKHIQQLIDEAKKWKVTGIQIDYENLKAGDKAAFSSFMDDLSKACKANGFLLGIALPWKVDDQGTWDDPQSRDYKAIGKDADQFVPMTYDLHWSTSGPGAVTSPEWSEMVAKYSASVMEPGKVDIGYPAYGYDWVGSTGETITWQDFMDRAKKYNVKPVRETDYSQELHISYTDEKGQHHEAWMTDDKALELQADIVKKYHLYGLGVWYFGSEDEGFWSMMKKINATPDPTLGALSAAEDVYASGAAAAGPVAMKELVGDNTPAMYAYAYPEQAKITVVERQNKRWVDAVLKANAWTGFGVGLDRTNLLPYMKTGALQFYVRGTQGGESMEVGFLMDTGLKADEKTHLETTVPLNNYVQVSKQWTLVTIPLADFSSSGHHYDDVNDVRITGDFKWDKVIEFNVDHAPTADPTMEVQFSSIRIIPTYDRKLITTEKNTLE